MLDRCRDAEARRLRIRRETLGKEVAGCRAELEANDEANSVKLTHIEPWPEPVVTREVLDAVLGRFTRYLFLPSGAPVALTLWCAHAHGFRAFLQTPRLNLSSPQPGCGKTTTLDVIASLTPRPLRTENLTTPVLFRVVDQHHPTLLLDEVDAYLYQNEELRGLLNAGHKRGACAYRCDGRNNGVRSFDAFAPAVLAGIGSLPDTLADRSIIIYLIAADPNQVLVPFDPLRLEIETVLARQLARSAQDNFVALETANPVLPPTAFNRLADNWRPLFAHAQIAGGDWPRLALEAFNQLAGQKKHEPLNPALALLAELRQIITDSGLPSLSTTQILQTLGLRPSRPWLKRDANQPLSQVWLANQLRRFGIHPRILSAGANRHRGYYLTDFASALVDRVETT
jgi:putative DNA primase/helicase